jgi:hypothetical protein
LKDLHDHKNLELNTKTNWFEKQNVDELDMDDEVVLRYSILFSRKLIDLILSFFVYFTV